MPAMSFLYYCEPINENHLCLCLKQNHPEILISSIAFLHICLLTFNEGLFSGLRNALGFKAVWFGGRVESAQFGASSGILFPETNPCLQNIW